MEMSTIAFQTEISQTNQSLNKKQNGQYLKEFVQKRNVFQW